MINYSFSIYDLEYFLLIFVRITAFIYIAPFFGMNNTPRRFKIGLGFVISVLVYQVLTPSQAVVSDTLLEYALIVMKEVITGLLIGFGANVCMSVMNFAGHIADMETGLTMVSLLDPATRENVTITGAMYQYGFTLMLIASGMYRYLLGALVDSFSLIPVNGAIFRADSLLVSMTAFLSDYITIGFRIILPIFISILLLNAVLGIMAKVSPQMNMFAIGMQIKIVVGLGVLFLTIGMLPGASDFLFKEMKKMMVSFIGALT